MAIDIKFDIMTIKEPLLSWYRKEHRNLAWRNTKNPYYIWLSEIMLQQTRVEAVKGYYDRFLAQLPDIKALSEVSEERLLKLWEGLGYYNRARNLKKAAICIMEQYDGIFPDEYEKVLALPGIGEYTAGAICSICFERPTPAVDGNVLRVAMRLCNCYDNIDDMKTKRMVRDWLMQLYVKGNCGELTQAFMELGAVICIPNGKPHCEKCPLAGLCLAKECESYNEIPVRKKKQKRRIVDMTVFILHDGEQYGIRKRKPQGLLAGLWEFYHVDYSLSHQKALDYMSEHGFSPVELEREIPYTHVFSHVEWRMTAYFIKCSSKHTALTWVDRDELEREYALPTAFKFFLKKE